MKSENIKEILLGCAIGDGCIRKNGCLQITHSIKQKEYIIYKKILLESVGFKVTFKEFERESYGEIRKFVMIYTNVTELGKSMRKYMYLNDIKIIPDDLNITPLMWSLIFQDDGRQNKISHYISKKGGINTRVETNPWVNRYTIYTDCFDDKSIQNIIKSLKYYNIDSRISYSNKNKYPHIHITNKISKTNFKELICNYICDNMDYKLDLPTYLIS